MMGLCSAAAGEVIVVEHSLFADWSDFGLLLFFFSFFHHLL